MCLPGKHAHLAARRPCPPAPPQRRRALASCPTHTAATAPRAPQATPSWSMRPSRRWARRAPCLWPRQATVGPAATLRHAAPRCATLCHAVTLCRPVTRAVGTRPPPGLPSQVSPASRARHACTGRPLHAAVCAAGRCAAARLAGANNNDEVAVGRRFYPASYQLDTIISGEGGWIGGWMQGWLAGPSWTAGWLAGLARRCRPLAPGPPTPAPRSPALPAPQWLPPKQTTR